MFKLISGCFILLAAARPVSAQVYLGAEMNPGALLKAEEAKPNQENDEAFARAFVLENSTEAVYSVFKSTTPERTVADYLRQGLYRQELLMLFAMAGSSGVPFSALAREREKGATLRELAGKHNADLLKLFRAARARQKALEEKAALTEGVFTSPASSVPVVGAEFPASAAHEDEKK
ncbi:MAG: hypothetical protein HY796_00175 [Elusimicrobia bacterium]|nr:hypothetical protein [Elusimicrobiota bacterium]